MKWLTTPQPPPADTNHYTWPHPANDSTSRRPHIRRRPLLLRQLIAAAMTRLNRWVCSNGIVCVSWQQVSIGRHHAGQRCDVHVDGELLRFWIGDDLVKTAARTSTRRGKKQTERHAPARKP